MLLKQKQRQDTRNALSSESDCQFPLQFVIKTTACILVLFNVIDACVKKTIETHKCWYNSLDYQFCRILNRCFAPTNLKRKAHALSVLHQLQSVILTHWTISDFRNNLLPVGSNFSEFIPAVSASSFYTKFLKYISFFSARSSSFF